MSDSFSSEEVPSSAAKKPFSPAVWLPLFIALSVIAATFVGAALAVQVSPVLAFSALWQGAFGDTYAISETLVRTIPLLFTGLGVALAFRCGIWNIGAEGQFLVGAAAVMAV